MDTNETEKSKTVWKSQRVNDRYVVRWRAAIQFMENNKKKIIYGRLNDISVSGVSINIPENIACKDEVLLWLEIPPFILTAGSEEKKRMMKIYSKIVYVVLTGTEFRAGISFTRFEPGDSEWLAENLRKHLKAIGSTPHTALKNTVRTF